MARAKLQAIERIDELIAALAAYEERTDRKVELIVRSNDSYCLMGEEDTAHVLYSDGFPPAFEPIRECESLHSLMDVLTGRTRTEVVGE
jgi:hypothetical protein